MEDTLMRIELRGQGQTQTMVISRDQDWSSRLELNGSNKLTMEEVADTAKEKASDDQEKEMMKLRLAVIKGKLEEIGKNGKFGANTCTVLKDLWQNFMDLDDGAKLDVDLPLAQITGNCVFGGGWLKVPAQIKSDITRFVSDAGNSYDEDDKITSRFGKMCRGLVYIIEHDVWFAPYLEKMCSNSNSTDAEVDIEAVNSMWSVEDCDFIKARIEKLCLANELTKALMMVKGTILKFQNTHDSNLAVAASTNIDISLELDDSAISRDDFIEFGAFFVLLNVKLGLNLTPIIPFFSICVRDCIKLRLLDEVSADRIAYKWKKGWKYKDNAALAWVEHILFANVDLLEKRSTTLQIGWNIILDKCKNWLETAQKLNQQKYNPEDHVSKVHMYNLTPLAQEQLTANEKMLLNTIPIETIDHLCAVVNQKSYLLCFAAALRDMFGSKSGIRSKCIQLCVTALLHHVNELELLRMRDTSTKEYKDVIQAKENELSSEYKELSTYLEDDPSTCFEVVLASFSLNPSEDLFKHLERLAQERSRSSSQNASDEWANVVWELTPASVKSEKLGIPELTFGTLMTVATNSRLNNFNFNTMRPSWSIYEPLCLKHLDTRGSEIKDMNNLEMARPDYSQFSYSEEIEVDDDMIFESGFEPGSDEEEENPTGKKPRMKEPPSRLRMWKSAVALQNRENTLKIRKASSVPKKKMVLHPNSKKCVTPKTRTAINHMNQETTACSATEDENFTEEFELLTLPSRNIDISKLCPVTSTKVKLSASELMHRLSLSPATFGSPNLPPSRTTPKQSMHDDTPRASLSSQRKIEQPTIMQNYASHHKPFVYPTKMKDCNLRRSVRTVRIETGNVPMFSHLFPNMQNKNMMYDGERQRVPESPQASTPTSPTMSTVSGVNGHGCRALADDQSGAHRLSNVSNSTDLPVYCPVLERTEYFDGDFSPRSSMDIDISPPVLECYSQT